jgi:hypothetical protein
MDLNMLAMGNSQERTLQQFTELGCVETSHYPHSNFMLMTNAKCRAEAGLQLVKVWDLGEAQLLEFRRNDSF